MPADMDTEQLVAEFLKRLGAYLSGKTNDCPHCGKAVEREEQIGRCVYVYPCGCRAYQGKVRKGGKG